MFVGWSPSDSVEPLVVESGERVPPVPLGHLAAAVEVLGPPAIVLENKLAGKASSGKVEGRKLYLTEDVHFRLRMLAYQRGQKLSECALEVLDKALPKWNVDRIG
jgi:hypothetical protein